MKNINVAALAKAIASILPMLYFVLAFGGLVSNHYLPCAGHVCFAIAESVLLTVIFYYEIVEEEVQRPSSLLQR